MIVTSHAANLSVF